MKRTAYLAGYAGQTPERLLAAARRLDTPPNLSPAQTEIGAYIVDIRLKAQSYTPHWRAYNLRQFFGWRYLHYPSLGNLRYKAGPPVEIADLDAGIELLETFPACCPVILLCGCEFVERCHRSDVGIALQGRGWDVCELDWEGDDHVPYA
jgi:hypothetical protein